MQQNKGYFEREGRAICYTLVSCVEKNSMWRLSVRDGEGGGQLNSPEDGFVWGPMPYV